jgi:hypothetical protein
LNRMIIHLLFFILQIVNQEQSGPERYDWFFLEIYCANGISFPLGMQSSYFE